MKSAQREAWKNLLKSPNKAVASLAEHVLALEKFQTTQFLRHLTLIIVKTRSQKNFQEMPCPNATRRYICGREASILASRNMYSPAADDKHACYTHAKALITEMLPGLISSACVFQKCLLIKAR